MWAVKRSIRNLCDTGFFSSGDHMPWCDPNTIVGCEREVSEAANGVSDELKRENYTPIVQPIAKEGKAYLLAVGYYRSGEYRRSWQLAEQCLEIAPDWMQALTLKKTVDDQITKDGVIGIGITATVVGLVAGGIAASLARKN
ncbi:hypothetical protein HYC85_015210 [Camellia sinensis]|uniref:Mitochondrial fission 1 protein n=1 Tax=Camellia sinensis TaxID=4442 RepID=A0A7J7GW19_CAMSI|nr:hypothetical protein HYC85_015210 [Camellia sinensis]